jgi:HrpA-like RNA helicase
LHGGLNPHEKEEVMKACEKGNMDLKNTIKVVLASRIAETAITLGLVKYVIDSGKEKDFYFNEETCLFSSIV